MKSGDERSDLGWRLVPWLSRKEGGPILTPGTCGGVYRQFWSPLLVWGGVGYCAPSG